MIKLNDAVMFYTLSNDKVVIGRGSVVHIGRHVIYINWVDNTKIVEIENVFPFDNEKYDEMCDTNTYNEEIEEANEKELNRLEKVLTQK